MARIYATGGKTFGTDSADEIYGSSQSDFIFSGAGNDIVRAGGGNDTIFGSAGRDVIDGGANNDTVSYYGAAGSVVVNLSLGVGYLSDAEGDTYTSIENVTGSNYADIIVGNSGSNVLKGYDGGDYVLGGDGADTMDGGDDSDALSYVGSSAGVTVNLAAGAASGGDAQGDTFVNFENLVGSSHSDTLTGTIGDNSLWGEDGGDFLFGLGGADTLNGGAGIDTIDGGDGNDTLNGGRDGDIMWGGQNADTFVFDTRSGVADQGVDVIMDFVDGVDHLRFDINIGTNGMSQLTIFEVLGNTVINYDNGSVTLLGVSASQVTAADIEFV